MWSESARRLLDKSASRGLDLRPALTALRHRLRPTPPSSTLVSIIMPVRNRATIIPRAIASVLAQTYQNWQLLIIDDGSTDGTDKTIRPYLAHRRIRYIKCPPRGSGAARNTGLQLAQGGLIAYLDSDNAWHEDFLLHMAAAFADPVTQSAYGTLLRVTPDGPTALFEIFCREKLQQTNFIDLNIYMHRRSLHIAHGGFDETLKRLVDWDLILRHTAHTSPCPVAAAACHYYTNVSPRISDSESYLTAYNTIRAKWRRHITPPKPLRVLFALWHYPQISETYIEAEIQALLRRGVHVEIWSQTAVSAPYPSPLPIHRGSIDEAIAAAAPDIVHVYWLNIALQIVETVRAHGLPLTVRGHGFEVTSDAIERLLAYPTVRRIYLYQHQIAATGIDDPRITPVQPGFDTALVTPNPPKNHRLIIRTSAGLPSKDLRLFLEIAKRLPAHRCVLAVVSCSMVEHHIAELLALRRELDSPAEILLNLPHTEALKLVAEAGIYLHTALAPDEPQGTPLGMPISIAEAMASGCYVLARNIAPYAAYLGGAGSAYDNIAHAEQLIAATTTWSEAQWRQTANRAGERAWTYFTADDAAEHTLEDWIGCLPAVSAREKQAAAF